MAIYDVNGNSIEVGDVNTFEVPIIVGGLPVVFITSDTPFTSLTKDSSVNGNILFVDGKTKFDLPIKMKLQGNNSLQYAKKNLNITFYNSGGSKQKIIFGSWYPTNKIHLKANEYDYSMCRNSVGSILAYEMCGKKLPKGARGYIDSFPIVMYYNDEYMGCYTFNLPQDGKTYNFKDSLETEGTNLAYRTTGAANSWQNSSYWEFRGDKDETQAMRDVFDNTVIPLLNNSSLTKEDVEEHFDVNTLLYYLVFAQISCSVDSMTNNWTLVTWDGDIWYHTWYDLDICFGIGGLDGASISATKDVFSSIQGNYNTFFQQVKTLYADEMESVYADMRNHGANTEYIVNKFYDFQGKWGQSNIIADRIKWEDDKTATKDIDIIEGWLTSRFVYLDSMYNYSG